MGGLPGCDIGGGLDSENRTHELDEPWELRHHLFLMEPRFFLTDNRRFWRSSSARLAHSFSSSAMKIVFHGANQLRIVEAIVYQPSVK